MTETKARELEDKITQLRIDVDEVVSKNNELDALLALICSNIIWLGKPDLGNSEGIH